MPLETNALAIPRWTSVIALSCLCVAAVVRLALHRDQVESGSTSEETA